MPATHIAVIRSAQNGKLYHCKLLCRSVRDDQGPVQMRTLANLSQLAGRTLVDPAEAFDILSSRAFSCRFGSTAARRRG